MTCIIGYKDIKNERVYIGADSLCSNDHSRAIRSDPKFFKYNESIIFGFTTSYRMGQLLMYADSLFSGINIFDKDDFTHEKMEELIKIK